MRRFIRRRLLFPLLMLFATATVIEACSWLATVVFIDSPANLARHRRTAAKQHPFQPGGFFNAAGGVIHPYLGAVMQPRDDGGRLSIDGKFRVTEFGFVDTQPPIHHRSPDTLIVGIVGGSVARQLSMNAGETLAAELLKIPQFSRRKIQLVRLASDGYKQPQQLMTLCYLLMLGAEFDILINLDGVNEAALPATDNVPFGVFAAYPRDWGKIVAVSSSPEYLRMGGYVSYLRQQQVAEARRFDAIPWRYSPSAQLVWAWRHHRSSQLIAAQLQEMDKFSEKVQTYGGSGPPEHFDSEDEMFDHCTAIWTRSSILMHQICSARGIRYFHCLQPNQYVPGSKPMSPGEAATAVNEASPLGRAVRACFPRMQARAGELAGAGVRFSDLTGVFADHPEPIYNDACCHVVPAGDVILAKAIAARIAQGVGTD